MKKRILISIILVIIALVSVLAISYALFSYSSNNQDDSTLSTGTLIVNLDEKNSLSLLETYPISDTVAQNQEGYKFEINNTGTETANYRLYIIDDDDSYEENNVTNEEKLSWSKLRYAIYKNNEQVIINDLSDDGILYTSTIKSGVTDKFELKIWMNGSATNEDAGLSFYGKLRIKAILENRTNYDTGE